MSDPGSEGKRGFIHLIRTGGPMLGLCAFVLLVFDLWFICAYFVPQWHGGDLAKSGQFGDTFGSVNALFSGLAMVGVGFAVFYQHQELEHAKGEADKNAAERDEAMRLQRAQLEIAKNQARESDEARVKAERALADQIAALLATAKLNAASSIIQANDSIAKAGGRTVERSAR